MRGHGPLGLRPLGLALVLLSLGGCTSEPAAPADGEIVEPPFEVRGDVEGLLLVWFDEDGAHSAATREEVPAAHRERVRVEDLALQPGERLDADSVYVADLRAAGDDGSYTVRRVHRATFEEWVEGEGARVAAPDGPATADNAAPGSASPADPAAPTADVVIYGASWCGACRSTASYLRAREIPFIERDVEREPGAREAMLRAARGAGMNPSGIPVIDFRGVIIAGFDRPAIDRAIERSRSPI